MTKRDAVAEWLRGEILSGRLSPGARLHQDAIAQRLSVSPTPVREAFRALAAEGLVDGRPHHAVTVMALDLAEVGIVYEVRSMVEVASLRHGIARLDDQAIAGLKAIVERASQAVKRGNLRQARLDNLAFHEALVALSGSRTMAEIARTLSSRSRFLIPLGDQELEAVGARHEEIVAMLTAGDGEGAVLALERHMQANLEARVSPSA